MNDNNNDARNRADSMLETILKSQPGLLTMGSLSANTGNALGEFIAGLRNRLTEMYQQQQR